jgi:hypothetical protein
LTARWTRGLALALALAADACGGGGGVVVSDAAVEEQSIVVIHLNFDAALDLRQIRVNAHLGSDGLDSELFFPTTPTPEPIPPGATLALLIPTTRMGLLDLIVYGLDAGRTPIARGNGQTTIVVGDRVDPTISLSACATPGCG